MTEEAEPLSATDTVLAQLKSNPFAVSIASHAPLLHTAYKLATEDTDPVTLTKNKEQASAIVTAYLDAADAVCGTPNEKDFCCMLKNYGVELYSINAVSPADHQRLEQRNCLNSIRTGGKRSGCALLASLALTN